MNKDNTNKDNTNKDNTNKDNTNKDNTDNMNRNEKYELLQNNSKTEGKDRITIEELNKIMRMAEKDIRSAPKGTLYAIPKGKKYQYYCKTDGKPRMYIKRSEDDIAKRLAQKEYEQKVYKMAKHDIAILDKIEKLHYRDDYFCINQKLTVAKQNIVTSYIYDNAVYAETWENKQKAIKDNKQDSRVYALGDEEEDAIMTEKGEIVRSKSEKIISDKLYMLGIPYVYEFPLNLNGIGYIRPDFYVLNVRTREAFYWEHFGMMDDSDYSEKAIKRIESYEKNKIFPGRNLILTYETSNHPINNKTIDEIINEYLI